MQKCRTGGCWSPGWEAVGAWGVLDPSAAPLPLYCVLGRERSDQDIPVLRTQGIHRVSRGHGQLPSVGPPCSSAFPALPGCCGEQ